MNFQRLFVFGLGLGLLLPPAVVVVKSVSVKSAAGITAQFDGASGRYEITTRQPVWKFAGELGQSAQNVVVEKGSDRIGAYQEIRFTWRTNISLTGSIRIYDSRPVTLFTLECDQAADELPALFPQFTSVPAGLHHFSFKNVNFAPPSFGLEQNGTPWLLFDDRANAVIISPADNFMIASMSGDGMNKIASGLNPEARNLPAHFQTRHAAGFRQRHQYGAHGNGLGQSVHGFGWPESFGK